jgi:polyisoprenoid-binding protein YceI
MNYFLGLIHHKHNINSMLCLIGFWLLLTCSVRTAADVTTSATNLQCNLAENSRIEPAVIAAMIEAADKGYLYRIDTTTSHITFQVNHFPFSSVEGHFNNFQGGVTLPVDANLYRQALFLIKADSVTTGDDELDEYLKSAVFFDAAQFPDIIFVSTAFEWIDESTALLFGELTLRGRTRSLILIAHMDKAGNHRANQNQKMIITASAEIQRSEFGMHEMQLLISDTVHFNLKIEASRVGI